MSWKIKINKTFPDLLIIGFAAMFWMLLWSQKDKVIVPNSDFFKYIYDGQNYLHFKIPPDYQIPPFFPIAIVVTAKLFTNYPYPEVMAGHFLNITFSSIIIIFVYKLLSHYSKTLSFITILLLTTNLYFIGTSLNITNDVCYAFFVTLVLLLYQKKHYKFSYLIAGFTIFIRYDSLAICSSLLLLNNISKNEKKRNFLILIFPIILYFLFVIFKTNPAANYYLIEIKNGLNKIPDLKVLDHLLNLITSNSIYDKNLNKIFSIIITFYSLFIILKSTFPKYIKLICLNFVLNIFLFLFIPNFCLRYLFSTIWVVYFIIINQSHKYLKKILVLILLAINILQLKDPKIYNENIKKSECKYVADWFNSQQIDNNNAKILIYEPFILEYYLHNKNIIIDSLKEIENKTIDCNNQLLCIIKKFHHEYKTDIFIVSTSGSQEIIDDYYGDKFSADQHFIYLFKQLPLIPSNTDHLKLIISLNNNQGNWANIFQYIP